MGFESLWQIGAFLCAAGAVYGGIRNDLKNMHERQMAHEKQIEKLGRRIDDCAMCKGRRRDD